tara:strand:- start:2443 stop:2667 length:225 start_codon:yes stop_codon:yes gene_type:complete
MKYSVDMFVGIASVDDVSDLLDMTSDGLYWEMVESVERFDNGVIVRTIDLDRYERDDLYAVLSEEYGWSAVSEL